MAYPVVHFEVTGKDIEKLKSFYSDLFDWQTQDFSEPGLPPYAMVEKAEGGIAGGIGSVPDGGNGHVTFYVAVPDPQATLDKAVSLGGTVVMPVSELPMVTLALFTDPEGHMIGIVKDQPPA
jgi:predicted enzyme related to lactoylglutathione lyase